MTLCFLVQIDLRSTYERSEDPDTLLVKNAELQVSKWQGSMTQVSTPYTDSETLRPTGPQNISFTSTLNPDREGLPGVSFCISCCSVQAGATFFLK